MITNTDKLASLALTAPWILRLQGGCWRVLARTTKYNKKGEEEKLLAAVCPPLRWDRCLLTPFREILSRVRDEQQIPLDLHQADLTNGSGDLPLDDEAGFKLALVVMLVRGVGQSDRVELIARRIERMTREEAGYLLSRCRDYGKDESRFAVVGLRILLGGQPRDPGVVRCLSKLKVRY